MPKACEKPRLRTMGGPPEPVVGWTAPHSLRSTPMPGDDRPPRVAAVDELTSGARSQWATDGGRVRFGPGRIAVALATGPFRWFQINTWRATADLVLWCVMSVLSAAATIVWLPASLVTRWGGERGTGARLSVLHLLAEAVRLDLRRIEALCGVRIDPLALAGPDPGAAWRERQQAWEREPWRWRLSAYKLANAVTGAALTAAAVAWWWGTVACFVIAENQELRYGSSSSIRVLGVSIGPVRITSIAAIGLVVGGVVGVLLWPTVVRAVSAVDVALARVLLGPSTGELSREVVRLSETRSQAVAAAADERRRIERDLHDGFQPQLVNLALTLGLARSRLASDPDAVRSLLDQAHDDAKRATADLRNLVRGIHPSVLDERGLDAAFSALAAGSGVPLQIDVHLDRRPPREAEGIAYFVVAEAITNINKHSQARVATITVTEIAGALRVLIQDDGRGGALPEPGGGLAGLDARVAGVDGTFSVTSPEGGPTWIEARIPCGS
jgi:signal transduction histidine kinase